MRAHIRSNLPPIEVFDTLFASLRLLGVIVEVWSPGSISEGQQYASLCYPMLQQELSEPHLLERGLDSGGIALERKKGGYRSTKWTFHARKRQTRFVS
jgi:hypothetical protein